ncbi:NUDIX pyrophosphatase [Fictibacillus sp. b24]|uniref:NUDIX hydrolase n=1 Tax=Fictibacillus sp. b24 TaxID=3055863 RepID=UPI0025A30A5E|nr:NUDIX pyrophosphatase [Fictibacillus sp. b24]MDM5317131.1 NUDIX pyrophosphatase [Fictibacillus sp. b24]
MRAPYQVLVIPFRIRKNRVEYAILKRADLNYWQGIAGGGEGGETPVEAARREALEEAGLSSSCNLIQLDTVTSLPVEHVVGHYLWGEDVYVIPEYSFGMEVLNDELTLSREHSTYKWVGYEEALIELKWDSNKTALWELNERINNQNTKKEINANMNTK